MENKLLIIDFGSQVTQLIARRVREAGVYAEIKPYYTEFEEVRKFEPKAIIFSGGPASTTVAESPRVSEEIFKLEIPILGICYGEQLICSMLGGKTESSDHREFGRAQIEVIKETGLFDGVQDKQVWMSHGDRVSQIPEGFEVIAKTDSAPFAAIANEERKIYGVQFHPEVTHTHEGAKIISNFVHKIAGIKGDWDMAHFRTEAIAKIHGTHFSTRVQLLDQRMRK